MGGLVGLKVESWFLVDSSWRMQAVGNAGQTAGWFAEAVIAVLSGLLNKGHYFTIEHSPLMIHHWRFTAINNKHRYDGLAAFCLAETSATIFCKPDSLSISFCKRIS